MTSVLRQLQSEWNTLVPAARARGIGRVRLINDTGSLLETIAYRRARLEWLRQMLGTASDLAAMSFGVEIEMMMPPRMSAQTLAALITAAGVPCFAEEYNHRTHPTQWKLVTDGSLGDYSRGREVVSPPLRGEAGFDQVRKVAAVLKSSGCKVTKRCGLHVHVGARSEGVDFFKNVVRLYQSAEGAIDSFMAPSRRGHGTGYAGHIRIREAQMTSASTVDDVARAIGQTPGAANVRGSDRYCRINLKSFWQHGTIEFRQHQGTVEGNKIENWVRLCLRMAMASRQGPKTARTLDELMTAVDADQAEKNYFAGRARFFAPSAVAQAFIAHGEQAQIPTRRRRYA